MAYTEELYSLAASVYLNNGTSSTGAVKTVSQTIGALNKSAWDVTKAGAIIDAMSNCVSKVLVSARATKTYDIYDD